MAPATSPVGTRVEGMRWDRVYLGLYLAYIVLGFAARCSGWLHADATWFVNAARRVLDGSFDVYGFKSVSSSVPPLGASYAYSPLMAMLIAPFVAVADGLGWGQAWAERLMAIPLLIADVLAMHQLRRLVREWRPGADERLVFLGVLLSLCLTGFWVVSAYGGHDEGLVLLFLLLALRATPRNLLLGGAWAGLALAAKQTAAFQLLPVGLVLLAGGARLAGSGVRGPTGGGRWRENLANVAKWGGVALAVFGAFLLPAVLRNPDGAWYALVTQMSRLTTFGPGLPSWIDRAMQANLDAVTYAAWRPALLEYSNTVLVGVVVLAPGLSIWQAQRHRLPIGLVDPRLLALVAFGAIAQVVLGKWVSGHYYQLPLALVFVWDMVRTSSPAYPSRRVGAAFPWVGLGSAIAFRSITQFGTWWVKEGLVLALFVALGVLALLGAATRRWSGITKETIDDGRCGSCNRYPAPYGPSSLVRRS
ncbi:MAG: hypothetical protein ACJ78Q_11175 [Chloroflexia bacterium]